MKQFLPLLLVVSLLAIASIAQPPPPPGAPATLVINEIDYDQPGTDTAEFIELYNYGNNDISMSQVILILFNGANGTPYDTLVFPPVTVPADGYYTICGPASGLLNCNMSFADTADNVQNGSPDGMVLFDVVESAYVDGVSYEGDVAGAIETPGIPTNMSDNNNDNLMSISRVPNGTDTDNNSADFQLTPSTPGAVNDQTVGIPIEKKTGFMLFPNPVSNELNLILSAIDNGASITISNMLGKEISSMRNESEHVKMNTTLLPEGVYFVSVESPKGKITKRFIKR